MTAILATGFQSDSARNSRIMTANLPQSTQRSSCVKVIFRSLRKLEVN